MDKRVTAAFEAAVPREGDFVDDGKLPTPGDEG
jgi:hypothetical protein